MKQKLIDTIMWLIELNSKQQPEPSYTPIDLAGLKADPESELFYGVKCKLRDE